MPFKHLNCRSIYQHLTVHTYLSTKNKTEPAMANITTPSPVTTQPPTTTIAPAEEVPESPEVEKQSSMTIFFILLVVGMIFKVFKTCLSYVLLKLYMKIYKLTLKSLGDFARILNLKVPDIQRCFNSPTCGCLVSKY